MLDDTRKVQEIYGSEPGTLHQLYNASRDGVRDLRPKKFYFKKYSGIVGIEIEVEHFIMQPYALYNTPILFWNKDHDDSLKDQGLEWISIPLQGKNIDYALTEMENLFKWAKDSQYYFNHRCSIHVHINVSQLTMGQLQKLYIIYALLEPWFFAWCNNDRSNNPFCVPLWIQQETFEKYTTATSDSERKGLKYLALANNHLHDYGTIEFRHLHGTDDMILIRRWIMMIQKLFKYAAENRDNIVPYETNQYELAKTVFNTLYPLIPPINKEVLDHSKNAAYLISL